MDGVDVDAGAENGTERRGDVAVEGINVIQVLANVREEDKERVGEWVLLERGADDGFGDGERVQEGGRR